MASSSFSFSDQPFQQLVELETLCQTNATRLPIQHDAAHSWSGVGFRLADQYYVAPFDEVSEVLYELHYTLIPGVKPWVKGLANVRGRLLTVIDLNSFLNQPAVTHNKMRRIIVIDYGDIFTGFIVDEVFGMQHFLFADYQEQVASTPKEAKKFIHGAFHANHEWRVFSLEELAQSPDFFAIVS